MVTLLRGGEEGKGKTIKRDKYADRKIYIEREMHRTHGPRTESWWVCSGFSHPLSEKRARGQYNKGSKSH